MRTSSYKKTRTTTLAMLIIVIMGMLIAYPQLTFEGAAKGMDSWLKIVFPALLPFFVGAEIMIAIGIVDSMSILLTPIMEPLFGCPGSSSFVWAMSATSGYPTCARLVTSLRQQGKIDKIEGQRILAFASTSGPLFMLGAVGIGMLNSPRAGRIIAVSHYISAFVIGLIFKHYGKRSKRNRISHNKNTPIFKEAIDNMYMARKKDSRTFGQMLGDSIKSSFETLIMVGGFLIIFSALIHLILKPFPSDQTLLKGVLGGLLEMTTGCITISQSSIPFAQKIAGICFIIGWSGVSVHCQVASMISKTDISMGIYIATKLAHGALSSIIGWLIAKNVYLGTIQTFNPLPVIDVISCNFIVRYSIKLFVLTFLVLCFIGILIGLLQKKIFNKI